MSAVSFAHDVLAMQNRIWELEHEVARLSGYEQKYHELIGDSIEHNQKMVGNLFVLGMKMAREIKEPHK